MTTRGIGGSEPIAAVLAIGLLAGVLLVACGPADGTPDASGSEAGVPASLQDLPVATVALGDLELIVAVADSPAERTRGVAGAGDLGPLGGVLFVFPDPVDTAFTMRGTTIALDIAFIDAAGRVLSVLRMEPCRAARCPTYEAPALFRWAVETPAGGLVEVAPGDPFVVRD